MYSVVDLFAGAGGLSLGFCQTHKFDIKVAFEKNPDAQKTYIRNHPNTKMYEDVCNADYADIKDKYGNIDVVIGGPPCQGFSNANRQKNHAISQNNMLVKQYVRAILELQPSAFIMENVSMLKSNVHRFYLEETDIDTVQKYFIPTQETELRLLDEEYADAKLASIVSNQELTNKYLWDESDYLLLNVIYKQRKNAKKCEKALEKYRSKLINLAERLKLQGESTDNLVILNDSISNAIFKYFLGKIKTTELTQIFEKSVMIQRMLSKAKEVFDNKIVVKRYLYEGNISVVIRSFAVFDYIKYILGAENNGYILDSNVLCAAAYGAPQKRMRFVIMGIKNSISEKVALPVGHIDADEYCTVRDAISDLSEVKTVYHVADDKGTLLKAVPDNISSLAQKLRDSDTLYNHIITATRETAMKRFEALKQGQNFHSLDTSMKENTYTDVSRTQNTIYLRLKYDEPSGTVVNVRKSMWIHPELNRAISVREAARLQTFPDSFVFVGTKDSQYQQVGNAVPPILSIAIAKKLYKLLEHNKKNK